MLVWCAHVFLGGGGSGKARGIDQRLCAYCETLHYVYAHVCDCAHMVYCITGHSIQSSAPLLLHTARPPLHFSTRLIFAQPFILARSSARQKETSAQWENALIIHDHLTIQDLVCAAYVAFLISARQTHLLMAVSLLLFCVPYLQINETRLANNNIALFARSWWITIRDKFRTNVFAFVEKEKKKYTEMGMMWFLSPCFSLVCFSCNLPRFKCFFLNPCDIRTILLLWGTFCH